MGLLDGLFGNDKGDGPQWEWAAKSWEGLDKLLGNDHESDDDQTTFLGIRW